MLRVTQYSTPHTAGYNFGESGESGIEISHVIAYARVSEREGNKLSWHTYTRLPRRDMDETEFVRWVLDNMDTRKLAAMIAMGIRPGIAAIITLGLERIDVRGLYT